MWVCPAMPLAQQRVKSNRVNFEKCRVNEAIHFYLARLKLLKLEINSGVGKRVEFSLVVYFWLSTNYEVTKDFCTV